MCVSSILSSFEFRECMIRAKRRNVAQVSVSRIGSPDLCNAKLERCLNDGIPHYESPSARASVSRTHNSYVNLSQRKTCLSEQLQGPYVLLGQCLLLPVPPSQDPRFPWSGVTAMLPSLTKRSL